MRKIQRTISLEEMTSRLPGVWPAYLQGSSQLLYFDDASLKARDYAYTSNYGLVPCNIVLSAAPSAISKIDDITVTDELTGCGCDSLTIGDDSSITNGNGLCNYTLSYASISKIYHMFKEYYHLLNDYGHCGRTYYSAEDYYNYESASKYSDQMVYGSDLQTYLDKDEEFKSFGGIPYFKIYYKKTSKEEWVSLDKAKEIARDPLNGGGSDNNDSIEITDSRDEGFYKWICTNLIPTFELPLKYRDYWKVKRLYYPSVVEWLAWFQERESYEQTAKFTAGVNGETDTWNCTLSQDCCDCEEYFKRGGQRVYKLMQEWYDSVQTNISNVNSTIQSTSTACFVPSMILPISLQISIDDLGEFSILSNEYEVGRDYRVAHYGDEENTRQGTVVSKEGEALILEKGSGYTFDENFMEAKYDSDAWSSYTDRYIGRNPQEFDTDNFNWYVISDDNMRFTSSAVTSGEALSDITEQYKTSHSFPIERSDYGWVEIGTSLYEIQSAEYGINHVTHKKQYVYRDEYTYTPYTYMNGRQVYGEFYLDGANSCYYFPFFLKESGNAKTPSVECNKSGFNINAYKKFGYRTKGDEILYVEYNGTTYEIGKNDSSITVNGLEYKRISGRSETDNDGIVYLYYDEPMTPYHTNEYDIWEVVENASVNKDKDELQFTQEHSFDLHKTDEITGTTASKLLALRSKTTLVDDIGNEIEGIYVMNWENTYNSQPPEGTNLNPIYQVGNVANVSRYLETVEDEDFLSGNTNYYVGDIIESMIFYYKDLLYNEMCDLTSADTRDFSGDSLSAITYSTEVKKNLEEVSSKTFSDDIYCDITYYIGATLALSGKTPTYSLAKGKNHGVEYKETVRFKKQSVEYYLKKPSSTVIPSEKNSVSPHSVSYPINCYMLDQDLTTIESTLYDTTYEAALAQFKAEIPMYRSNQWTFDVEYPNDMVTRNNLEVMPTHREEYLQGISCLENVDSDIYIERGVNAAFEKHLKLGEITSLEALENYGNGYFIMMES